MFNLKEIFSPTAKKKEMLSCDEAAKLLATSPEALEAFEKAYAAHALQPEAIDDNFFGVNSRQAAAIKHSQDTDSGTEGLPEELIERIVTELVAQTKLYVYDGKSASTKTFPMLPEDTTLVTNADINRLPEKFRPDLTGELMKVDIGEPSYPALLYYYQQYAYNPKLNPKKRMMMYNMFRQGLDILDLDEITYEIIGRNNNSMGHWLPQLVEACQNQKFFKIPATTVAKVPLTLLQLTRQSYTDLSPSTLAIVDRWAMKVFGLDVDKDYFIKTGTYSSKFDFRNCHVVGESEVETLGEYLLFIHFQALQMASPLSVPTIFGACTTNEWVVREFIRDKENNPCIYKGLPLHTEYRAFVDCDEGTVLNVFPYWDAETMLNRFSKSEDANSPHQKHDYVVYKAHQAVLECRFNENVERVRKHLEAIMPELHLSGQWSIDIMQNGNDFWIIDMALAQDSAFYNKVPTELRIQTEQHWLPEYKVPMAYELQMVKKGAHNENIHGSRIK